MPHPTPGSTADAVMLDAHVVATLRALVDVTRLRIAGLLVGRYMRVGELATALGTTPSALVRHLDLLGRAGLLERRDAPGGEVFGLRVRPLGHAARALAVIARDGERGEAPLFGPDGLPYPHAQATVLRAFLADGRLRSIPAQERKRLVVLRYLARTVFLEDRTYPEKEVNQLLALRHSDVASLRRHLVDHGFMRREAGMYRLEPEEAWPTADA